MHEDLWDVASSDELGSGSDASFTAGAPKVVQRITHALAADTPAGAINKMCRSYDIVELEGAEPELFREGVAAMVAGLEHRDRAARPAFARALALAAKAVQGSPERLIEVASAVVGTGALHDSLVAGSLHDVLGMLVERLQTTSRAQVAGLHTQLVAVLQGACTACFCSGNDVSGADVPALLQLDCTVRWWRKLASMAHTGSACTASARQAHLIAQAEILLHAHTSVTPARICATVCFLTGLLCSGVRQACAAGTSPLDGGSSFNCPAPSTLESADHLHRSRIFALICGAAALLPTNASDQQLQACSRALSQIAACSPELLDADGLLRLLSVLHSDAQAPEAGSPAVSRRMPADGQPPADSMRVVVAFAQPCEMLVCSARGAEVVLEAGNALGPLSRNLATWLSTTAPQLVQNGGDAVGEAVASWLRVWLAICKILPDRLHPQALDDIAEAFSHALAPGSGLTSALYPVLESLAASSAELARPHLAAEPIAIAVTHVVRGALAAALDGTRARRAQRGSHVARKEQAAAWAAARSALDNVSPPNVHPAVRSALVEAGVDELLLEALLRAPSVCLASERDLPVSHAAAHAVAMLQQRMRWQDGSQRMCKVSGMQQGAGPQGGLVAVLRALRRGHSDDQRVQELLASGPSCILLALLVHPLLDRPESEAALSLVFGPHKPRAFVAKAWRLIVEQFPAAESLALDASGSTSGRWRAEHVLGGLLASLKNSAGHADGAACGLVASTDEVAHNRGGIV